MLSRALKEATWYSFIIMEDMEQQVNTSPSPSSSSAVGQTPGLATVRMRVVDDNLKDLETFPDSLKLKVINDSVNTRCILEFRGKGQHLSLGHEVIQVAFL